MPHATTDDGVKLFYEETGKGTPILFIHEFAGDLRSWEPQVRYFARRYRCITYNARGYPPSDVPADASAYGQARAVADARSILDHLKIEKAHVVGLSMGGFCALHFGMTHPERALSVTIGGCGYGAQPGTREKFVEECGLCAEMFENEGTETTVAKYAFGPTRVQFLNKDPRGFEEFRSQFAEHDRKGSANTQRGVQMQRPSLYDLVDKMKAMQVPALVITGDEDEPCLEPGLLMKRSIPRSGLVVIPQTGHACNLEEPDAFNRAVQEFITAVDTGGWMTRDPRAKVGEILGMKQG